MATLDRRVRQIITDFRDPDCCKKAEQEMAAICHNTDPDAADLTGSQLKFPRGDGYAYYVVCKHKPLIVQRIAIGDDWAVEPAMIRGLREQDVRDQLRQEAALRSFFAKPLPAGA